MSARNALDKWRTARSFYRKWEGARPILPSTRAKGTLIVLCGLPGSGKTTHAQAIVEATGAIHFDTDEWMRALGIHYLDEASRNQIETLQWTRAKELLALGQAVIFESGPWARSQRDMLRREARELGAAVELYYFTATLDVLLDRISRRGPEGAEITRELLEDWSRKLRAPHAFELALYDRAFRGGLSGLNLIRPSDPLTAYIAKMIDVVLPVARKFKALFRKRDSNASQRRVGGLHAQGADVWRLVGLLSDYPKGHVPSQRSAGPISRN